jgi:pyruvate dehydrogenase E2 component (dihydrolipoamide acetyltransferase)
MPILGADMEDGVLVEWRKAVGDRVRRGEIIADVETDKGLIEVEVFTDGVIEKICVTPGTSVPTGTVLAVIREDGTKGETAAPPSASAPAAAAEPTSVSAGEPLVPVASPVAPSPPPPFPTAGRVRASPAARRRADELGVDLAEVRGSGPEGAIQIGDVERAARAGAPAASPAEAAAGALAREEGPAGAAGASADRPDRMRQAIAAAMARSKREIPHYYLETTIDLHATLSWLTAHNEPLPVAQRLLPGVALLKAVALALREVRELNAVWKDGRAEQSAAIHLGVAVALRGGGLIAPCLHDADRKSLDELMGGLRELVERARAGRLRSSELSDSTITVTNLGDQGVEAVFGVIYPPQVAIVGFGKVVERPWVVEDRIVPRRVVRATLSADHRVSDGHRGARFLAALDRRLQRPEEL